jgi:hypothetical protein
METMDGKMSEVSGAFLMQNGINVPLRGDYDSTVVLLHRMGA